MSNQMPPKGSAAASVRTLFNDLVEETVDHQEQQQTTATVDDITRIDKTFNDSLVIEPLPSEEDRYAAAGPSSSHRNRFNAAAPNPPADDRGVFSTTGDHRSVSSSMSQSSSSNQSKGGGGGKTRMTFDEMWEYQVKSMRSLQRNDGTLPTPPSRTASARVPTRGGGSANQQSRTQSWSSTHSVDEDEELDDTTMGSEDGYLDRRNRALMRAEGISSRGRCDSFGSVGSVDSVATAPAEMGTMRRAVSASSSSSSASSSAGNEERRRNSDGGGSGGGSSSHRKSSSSSRTLSFLRSLMPDIAEEEVEKETPESVARKFQMKQTRRRKSTTSLGTVHTKRNDSHSSSGSNDYHHPRSHDDETPAQAHGGGNKKKSSTLLKLFSERISSNMEDEISNSTTTSGERRTEKAGSTTESSPSSSSSTSSRATPPARRSSFKVNKLTSWRRGGSKSNVMNVPRLGTASLAGECLGGEGSAEK